MFAYQTLDAIDGKQARRTRAGSPLGQLFDHGCDSVGTIFILFFTNVCLGMPFELFTFLGMMSVMVPFFLAQWEEHHTHCIRTFVGYIGVTEGQMVSISLMLISGFKGAAFFRQTLSSLHPALPALELNNALMILMALANTYIVLSNLQEVKAKTEGFGAFKDLIPLTVLALCCAPLRYTSGFEEAPRLYCLTVGAVFSHLTTQMIVCNVTHMDFSVLQPTALLFPLIIVNASLGSLPQVPVMMAFMAFVVFSMGTFILCSISQITKTLGIYCLSLGKRPGTAAVDATKTN
jgi:phosphatidylglycerophosphate synthase